MYVCQLSKHTMIRETDIRINIDIDKRLTCEIIFGKKSIIFAGKIKRKMDEIATIDDFNYYISQFPILIFSSENHGEITFLDNFCTMLKHLKIVIFDKAYITNHLLMPKKLHSFGIDMGYNNYRKSFTCTYSKYIQKIKTWSIEIFCNKLPKYLRNIATKIMTHDNDILPKYLHTFIFFNRQTRQILMPKNLVKLSFAFASQNNIWLPHKLKKLSIILHDLDVGINKIPDGFYLDTLIICGYKQGIIENVPDNIKRLSIEYDANFDINELYSIPNNLTLIEIIGDRYKKLQLKHKNFKKTHCPQDNQIFVTDLYTRL